MAATIGSTSRPANTLWAAPNTSFSKATTRTGTGARMRSSISLVSPNSVDSGRATATRPGTSTVANSPPPPPTPCPIRGNR